VGKPPRSPYPPDLALDAESGNDLGDLTDAVVADADWANRAARGLALRRVEVRRCRLTGAELAESSFTDVTFEDCRLDLTGLRFAKFERVVFRDSRLSECELHEASLEDVLFERCDLTQATLSGARIRRVELRDCRLAGAHGVEALRSARMSWSDVLENAGVFAAALGIEIVD
jgi:uncharacterized protein YjbI with pentapeptide repeats